jgi:hydrogenase expression/formation protein HypE
MPCARWRSCAILRETAPGGAAAAIIGRVAASAAEGSGVTLVTQVGTRRALDMLSGEQLPRIC